MIFTHELFSREYILRLWDTAGTSDTMRDDTMIEMIVVTINITAIMKAQRSLRVYE